MKTSPLASSAAGTRARPRLSKANRL
jgi:hypothetical protein